METGYGLGLKQNKKIASNQKKHYEFQIINVFINAKLILEYIQT